MLLAKLKFVLMGFASVALVTTGMGVVAQSPAPTSHPPDQDRLKAVEQKLDRLLEVLGGSSRSTSAMPPPVNALVQPGTPVAAYSRVPSADYVLTQPPAVATSPALASPVADTINKARFAHGYGQARATTVPTSPYGQSTSLDGRVASLEQRLNELERRFGEMERRLNQPRSGIDRGIGPDGRPVGSIRRPGSDRSDASPDRSPFGNTNPPESPDQTPFGDTERPASIDDDAIATAPRPRCSSGSTRGLRLRRPGSRAPRATQDYRRGATQDNRRFIGSEIIDRHTRRTGLSESGAPWLLPPGPNRIRRGILGRDSEAVRPMATILSLHGWTSKPGSALTARRCGRDQHACRPGKCPRSSQPSSGLFFVSRQGSSLRSLAENGQVRENDC